MRKFIVAIHQLLLSRWEWNGFICLIICNLILRKPCYTFIIVFQLASAIRTILWLLCVYINVYAIMAMEYLINQISFHSSEQIPNRVSITYNISIGVKLDFN